MTEGLAEKIRTVLIVRHYGRRNGVSCQALAERFDATTRSIRMAISELRDAGQPICGHPSSGYFYAETSEELEETCAFLRGRAMHSLTLESRLRRISLPELMGQMQLEITGVNAMPMAACDEGLAPATLTIPVKED